MFLITLLSLIFKTTLVNDLALISGLEGSKKLFIALKDFWVFSEILCKGVDKV